MTARLILICGLPGSGKTTVARWLEGQTAAVRLSPDEWLLDLGFDLYDDPARDRLESVLWRHAQQLLKVGTSVILENGFWSRVERDAMRQGARAIGAGVELHYLDAAVDELWQRIDQRNRGSRWTSHPMTREMLEGWLPLFDVPTAAELQLYDRPLIAADHGAAFRDAIVPAGSAGNGPHRGAARDFGVVILAGGRARRLGGIDKPSVPVAGVTMLERVIAAAHAASVTVVVGPPSLAVPSRVRLAREQPPGGGPVAALAAALPSEPSPPEPWPAVTVLLAGDLPLLTAAAIDVLIDAVGSHDGAVYVDGDGQEQWMCSAWQSHVLRRRLAAIPDPANYPLRRLLAGLDVVPVGGAVEPPPWFDCDTEDDIRQAEGWLAR